MKRLLTAAFGVAALALMGCPGPTARGPSGSGSAGLSADDALLYVADRDNGVLAVIDTATGTKVSEVRVGVEPMRVLVGADDTIYVANRGSRSVSVVRRGEWAEAARIEVGLEPTGLALTPDGRELLVTSSTAVDAVEYGTLAAFDTRTFEKRFDLPVGEEPRSVVVVGNKALVSLYKQGDLVEVDLKGAKVAKVGTGLYQKANLTRDTTSSRGGTSSFRSRAMADLVATPDGSRVFAPVVWAREDAIARRPSSSGGYYGGGGPCNIGAVATAGIVTFDTSSDVQPKVDDLTACASRGTTSGSLDFPVSSLAQRSGDMPIQGPTVAVVDPTGSFLYVLNRESRNLAVMPAFRRSGDDLNFDSTGSSVRSVVDVGHGADGLALSSDGLTAYVYNQFDHSVSIIRSNGKGNDAKLVVERTVVVAGDVLAGDLVAGRKLFFDARDSRMSADGTTVACSTCHLEGREDGHVWQFPDGPRQTPALAGRKLAQTAPYHWSGEFETLTKFASHTIRERMGGAGLDVTNQARLDAFVDALPVAPSPIAGTDPAALRGRVAFEKAQCATCHAGEVLTNNKLANVGTLTTGVANPDNGLVATRGFDVPSLLGLGRSAPFLHTGLQQTHEARVYDNAGDLHGTTSTLNDAEKKDLVVYLKSL